jgi:hypothetical protein
MLHFSKETYEIASMKMSLTATGDSVCPIGDLLLRCTLIISSVQGKSSPNSGCLSSHLPPNATSKSILTEKRQLKHVGGDFEQHNGEFSTLIFIHDAQNVNSNTSSAASYYIFSMPVWQ